MINKGTDKPSEGENISKIADVVAMTNNGALEIVLRPSGTKLRLADLSPQTTALQIIVTKLGGNKYSLQAYEMGNAQSAPMRTVSEYSPENAIERLGYASPITGVHSREQPEINMATGRYTGLTGKAGLDRLFGKTNEGGQ